MVGVWIGCGMDGKVVKYYESEGHYKNGDGKYVGYYETGETLKVGNFKDGKRVGKWVWYASVVR